MALPTAPSLVAADCDDELHAAHAAATIPHVRSAITLHICPLARRRKANCDGAVDCT
jgi:hypothetical protein